MSTAGLVFLFRIASGNGKVNIPHAPIFLRPVLCQEKTEEMSHRSTRLELRM